MRPEFQFLCSYPKDTSEYLPERRAAQELLKEFNRYYYLDGEGIFAVKASDDTLEFIPASGAKLDHLQSITGLTMAEDRLKCRVTKIDFGQKLIRIEIRDNLFFIHFPALVGKNVSVDPFIAF